MSLLTVPFKIFSTILTSSFKRKSVSLFFVHLQINATAVLESLLPGSIWICMIDDSFQFYLASEAFKRALELVLKCMNMR